MYPLNTSRILGYVDTVGILPFMDTWYDRASARMRELKITQDHLAATLGITRGGVGHYLRGRREPSLSDFILIAKRLQMSLDALLLGNGSEPSQPERLDDATMTQAVELLNLLSDLRPDDARFKRLTWGMIKIAAKAIARHSSGQGAVVGEILAELESENGA